MKKKTKVQPDEGEAKERQYGPVKGKTQITLRLDTELMNEVYAQMKEDNTRITEMVERGLILALGEARHELPAWTKQIRFVVANATQEQVRYIRGLAIRLVEPQVKGAVVEGQKRVSVSHHSPTDERVAELLKWWLDGGNKLPNATDCLAFYSRYGKSPQEIAKLGNL